MTSQYVQAKIRRFEKRFNEMKKAARGCLEKRKISVKQVVDALTSMPADDIEDHKLFLKDNLSDLYQSFDISELIGKLSLLQWNYLSYIPVVGLSDQGVWFGGGEGDGGVQARSAEVPTKDATSSVLSESEEEEKNAV